MKKIILVCALIFLILPLTNAEITATNSPKTASRWNLEIGDCWRGRTITDIQPLYRYGMHKGTKISWVRGCNLIQEPELEPIQVLENCSLVGNGNQENLNIIIKQHGDLSNNLDMNWFENKYPSEIYNLWKKQDPLNSVDVNVYFSKDNSDCGLSLKKKDVVFWVWVTSLNCYGGEIPNKPNIIYCNPFVPITFLHEVGHTFGLDHNSEKTNYMNTPPSSKANSYTETDTIKLTKELQDLNIDAEVLY